MSMEFSSLLLRLRFRPNNRAVNTSPPATSTPTNDNPVILRDSQSLPGTSEKEYQLGRKILKDPDAYIDSGVQGDRDAPQGLAPRPRRRSVDGKSAGPKKYRRSHYTSERTPETGQGKLVSSAYMQSSIQPEIKAFPSKLNRGREWSTFGRKRKRKSGNGFDLPGHMPQRSRSAPSRSSSSRRHPVQGNGDSASQDNVAIDFANAMSLSQPSTTSVPSYSSSMRESRGNQSTSRNSSPTSTVSSRRRPRTGHAATATLPAETRFTTHVARRLGFDSPHTFGCLTPHDRRRCRSSPPPLPPLDHPELAAALLARSRAANTKQPVFSNCSNIPSRQLFHQDPVSLMPSNFGISLRNHTSLPGIRHALESETPPPEPQRRRTRTVSGRPRNQRRNSAEWSAEQAVSGVTSPSNQAWPAEVSREILRLSLGEGMPKRSGAEPLSGSLGEDKSRTRAHEIHHFPHRAPIPPSLFPSSPRERVPSPLKEPVTLSSK